MTKHYILTPDSVVDALDSDVEDAPLSANMGRNLNELKLSGWSKDGTVCQTWKGTKAQYDAISVKDDNTLYFITDSPEGDFFNLVYPVGTVYTSVGSVLPSQFTGTWESIASSISGEYKWKRTA